MTSATSRGVHIGGQARVISVLPKRVISNLGVKLKNDYVFYIHTMGGVMRACACICCSSCVCIVVCTVCVLNVSLTISKNLF